MQNSNREKVRANEFVHPLASIPNGTEALQIAIKALGLSGEVITTPFSYVATISSIVWENCERRLHFAVGAVCADWISHDLRAGSAPD
jgi:hypothetical protein